jgi:hypothetical protein
MTWPNVAMQYGRLFSELCPRGPMELVNSA